MRMYMAPVSPVLTYIHIQFPSLPPLPPSLPSFPPLLPSLIPSLPSTRPLDKSVIVTKDEQRMLMDVSCEMEEILSYRIENFHKCFPFGQPKEDLLNTIKLYKLVSIEH